MKLSVGKIYAALLIAEAWKSNKQARLGGKKGKHAVCLLKISDIGLSLRMDNGLNLLYEYIHLPDILLVMVHLIDLKMLAKSPRKGLYMRRIAWKCFQSFDLIFS